MRYEVIHANELTNEMISRWKEIQESDFNLASPYFSTEFTQAVASVRNDVYIILIEEKNEIVGFFPFHRKWGGIARPVGLGLSDYHGPIICPGVDWSAEALLQGGKLVRFEFDHLLACQRPFARFSSGTFRSPIIDVSQGYDKYKEILGKSARKQLREAERKRDKLKDAIGPIRFIRHTDNPLVLDQLIAWKRKQCKETGTVDYFSTPWCANLIRHFFHSRNEYFGGMLSSLYAGDKLVAAHFALYTKQVWHSWFPTYNDALKEFSPGLILIYAMVESTADTGVKYIDLGKGVSLYKKRVMTNSILVAEGCAQIPALYNRLSRLCSQIEQYSQRSAFKPIFRIPGRVIKKIERKRRYV